MFHNVIFHYGFPYQSSLKQFNAVDYGYLTGPYDCN